MSGVKGGTPLKKMLYATQARGPPWKEAKDRELAMLKVVQDDLDNQQLSKDTDAAECM